MSLGRRGAQVACRSLGFATGAQLFAGKSSPLPAPLTAPWLITGIVCDGSETTLADCDIRIREDDFVVDYGIDVFSRSVALICTIPSGVLHANAMHAAWDSQGLLVCVRTVVLQIMYLGNAEAGSLDDWTVAGMKRT